MQTDDPSNQSKLGSAKQHRMKRIAISTMSGATAATVCLALPLYLMMLFPYSAYEGDDAEGRSALIMLSLTPIAFGVLFVLSLMSALWLARVKPRSPRNVIIGGLCVAAAMAGIASSVTEAGFIGFSIVWVYLSAALVVGAFVNFQLQARA